MNLRMAILGSALLVGLVAYRAPHAAEENTDSTQLPDEEKVFLDAVARGDKSEMELSKLALSKSHTPAVRVLAQQMLSDHNRNYADLQSLCEKKKYAIAPELDASHRAILRKLQAAASDDAFDRAYLDAMNADHGNMAVLLDRTANNSNDAAIKQFAGDTLLTEKKHGQSARDMAEK